MGIGIRDRVVEKLISMLKTADLVTKYTGSGAAARIYGAHLASIVDPVLPAVTIHLMPNSGRAIDGAFDDSLEFQIEPWMSSIGKNAFVWDDVMDCYAGIVDILHRCKGWDDTIGIKVIELTNIQKGPQLTDPDGILHFPSRWKVRATT